MLRAGDWRIKYTPDDGNLVELFYVPALRCATRYDRLTGYFSAEALTLAARGIEGLVANGGRMRLIVGCTLGPEEIEAVEKGEKLRDEVERRLSALPLEPPGAIAAQALELLAWMVGRGHLDVKVAVPCDVDGKPIPASGIFHEKAGIIADGAGDRIAWNGSLNETPSGWRHNWESINVYKSWGAEPQRVDKEENNFARIWANQSNRVEVFDVPEAVRRDLVRFMPANDLPARLASIADDSAGKGKTAPPPEPQPPNLPDLRSHVWSFIEQAPTVPEGGERVGEATSAITPWPHQVKAFDRLYRNWPPKLLIADEVGLGKTIQAGMLLRQAWLAGKLNRALILAPKAVLKQWQIELREKFNLNWPIYDGGKLIWASSPAWGGAKERKVGNTEWFGEPFVIASSQLLRRSDRAKALLQDAEPWDLVLLDEAHHARRRSAGAAKEGPPNALLELMRELRRKSQGLILLTATPMQVHPVEVWDLLNLLGLPPEWTRDAFQRFFEDTDSANLSQESMERMALLFRATETLHGQVDEREAERYCEGMSPFQCGKVVKALRDESTIPRRQLDVKQRKAAFRIMRAFTPIRRLISRHTRELLRAYFKSGQMGTSIAKRKVEDRFLELTPAERALYEAVEDYISTTYNKARADERNAVGFIMTVYRRRLASSFAALTETLRKRGAGLSGKSGEITLKSALHLPDEDTPDDETADEIPDADEMAAMARRAMAAEEQDEIQRLLAHIKTLPPDSKLEHLLNILAELRKEGYGQAMVFTQYTDTMDFLRDSLRGGAERKLMCFSGRGGEVPDSAGGWRQISRDEAKRRFQAGEADILLCTDAAAEGLNFQFCGAVVNYDMPWNPMRVEQRIGRIDRLGQEHATIRIVNLHYEDTVETDVYRALRERIGLFQTVVGPLQPILAQLPGAISRAVLAGSGGEDSGRGKTVDEIERQIRKARSQAFDIDQITEDDLKMPERRPSPLNFTDLDRVINSPELLPEGTEATPLHGNGEYKFSAPGMKEPLRVTTNPEYFSEHAESVELWSPGNPLFRAPELIPRVSISKTIRTMAQLLDD